MLNQAERIKRYYVLLDSLPESHLRRMGDPRREKLIVLDPQKATEIEDQERAKLMAKGDDPDKANIGIRREDHFSWHVVEPQWVPSAKHKDGGFYAVWHRTIWKDTVNGKSAVVVAFTKEQCLILVPVDRHGSQRWELEAPGGGSLKSDITWEQVAKIELLEETGYKRVGDLVPLDGLFVRSPSCSSSHQRTFLVEVCRDADQSLEEGEVMGRPIEVPLKDLLRAYLVGTMEANVPGGVVHLQNGNLAHALVCLIAARQADIIS